MASIVDGKIIWLIGPNPGSSQEWACKVRGIAGGGDVQIRVKAADGKWYPQPHVETKDMGSFTSFRGTAYLGWEENPQAKHYTIAAGVGGQWSNDVVENLPSDILWVTSEVVRI